MVQMDIGPLVRATSATSVTVWAEFARSCTVRLQVVSQQAPQDVPITVSVHTTTVGGRYYAAPQLHGLQAATWYVYRIYSTTADGEVWQEEARLQCFRTLDNIIVQQAILRMPERSLRLVYGSCRKLDRPQADVLSFFGDWLLRHYEQRETDWPHLLLLIGDQIYADHPADGLVQKYPQLRAGAR